MKKLNIIISLFFTFGFTAFDSTCSGLDLFSPGPVSLGLTEGVSDAGESKISIFVREKAGSFKRAFQLDEDSHYVPSGRTVNKLYSLWQRDRSTFALRSSMLLDGFQKRTPLVRRSIVESELARIRFSSLSHFVAQAVLMECPYGEGSMKKEREIEDRFKRNELPGIVFVSRKKAIKLLKEEQFKVEHRSYISRFAHNLFEFTDLVIEGIEKRDGLTGLSRREHKDFDCGCITGATYALGTVVGGILLKTIYKSIFKAS